MCTPKCNCYNHRRCEECGQTFEDIGFAPVILCGRSLYCPYEKCQQIVWREIKKFLPFNDDLSMIIRSYMYMTILNYDEYYMELKMRDTQNSNSKYEYEYEVIHEDEHRYIYRGNDGIHFFIMKYIFPEVGLVE
jgi:hypothetical protein